jgi:hypothetical protein
MTCATPRLARPARPQDLQDLQDLQDKEVICDLREKKAEDRRPKKEEAKGRRGEGENVSATSV